MQANNEKNEEENAILTWYNELPRNKKSKFIIALQLKLEMSQTTIYFKMRTNNWRSIERDAVEQVINEGTWEQ